MGELCFVICNFSLEGYIQFSQLHTQGLFLPTLYEFLICRSNMSEARQPAGKNLEAHMAPPARSTAGGEGARSGRTQKPWQDLLAALQDGRSV